ncbi:hypothetical protein JOM56_010312 [Amanita muscaria]
MAGQSGVTMLGKFSTAGFRGPTAFGFGCLSSGIAGSGMDAVRHTGALGGGGLQVLPPYWWLMGHSEAFERAFAVEQGSYKHPDSWVYLAPSDQTRCYSITPTPCQVGIRPGNAHGGTQAGRVDGHSMVAGAVTTVTASRHC